MVKLPAYGAGLLHHTYIVRMNSFDHTVFIPGYLIAGQVVKIFYTLPLKPFYHCRLPPVKFFRKSPRKIGPLIGIPAVVDHQNWTAMMLPQQFDTCFKFIFQCV